MQRVLHFSYFCGFNEDYAMKLLELQFWSSVLYDRASFQNQLAPLTTTKEGPHSESDDDNTPAAKSVNKLEDGLTETIGSLPPNEETSNDQTDHRPNKKQSPSLLPAGL